MAGAGFDDGRREDVLAVAVADLPRAVPPPRPDLRIARSVGAVGTRFTAYQGDRALGYLDVDTLLGEQGRFAAGQRLADIGNLWVGPDDRRRGVARWLLSTAAEWLDLAGVRLLLTYRDPTTEEAERAFVAASDSRRWSAPLGDCSAEPAYAGRSRCQKQCLGCREEAEQLGEAEHPVPHGLVRRREVRAGARLDTGEAAEDVPPRVARASRRP